VNQVPILNLRDPPLGRFGLLVRRRFVASTEIVPQQAQGGFILYRCGLMSGQRCRRSPTFTLTDDILATDPEAQPYKFTEVDDQVVIVDPAKKRVIAVIGPKVRD
jgi:hypothetical protein